MAAGAAPLSDSAAHLRQYVSVDAQAILVRSRRRPTDVVARILADQLSARWNMSVVVRPPGAGTIVMTTAVAKALPDGLTLGIATNSLLINPVIGMKLPYDTFRKSSA